MRIFATVLLALLALLVAGVLGFTGWPVAVRLHAMAAEVSWPETDATILSMQPISRRLKYGQKQWTPSWTYSYVVDGRPYIGKSTGIPYGYHVNWYQFETTAEREGLERPVGDTVKAYYDPHEPTRTTLDRATFEMEDAIKAGIFILVIAYMFDFVRRGRRRAQGKLS